MSLLIFRLNVNEKDGGGGGGRHEGVIFNIAMIYTICNVHVYICKPASKTVTYLMKQKNILLSLHMI